VLRQVLAVAMLAAATTGCALDNQNPPSLNGPSELGLSLGVSANPDFITQDGVSRSVIEVQARNGNNQAVAGVTIRVDTLVDGKQVEFGSLSAKTMSTDAEGRGSVVYTAPPPPPAGSTEDITVSIVLTPVGGNYANSLSRTAVIRLARPSIILPPTGTPPGAPEADFFFSPAAPREGDTVLFDGSPSKNAAAFDWNFGDGKTASGVQPTTSFDLAAVYTVTLTVTAETGESHSVQKTVTVAVLTAPTASFVVSPGDPKVGAPVFFNAQASKAPNGRRIASWEWDFGDGENGSGETEQHTYSAPGAYTVLLRVTDDAGHTATFSVVVTITP